MYNTYAFENMNIGDLNTGECLFEINKGDEINVISQDDKNKKQEAIQRQQLKSSNFKCKNEAYKLTHKLRGNFFVSLCNDVMPLCSNISEPTLNKIIYLATFIDSKNKISFDRACFDDGNRRTVAMTKKDIMDTLGITRRIFYSFWKEVTDSGLVVEKDGEYFLPNNIFRYCNSKKINKKTTAIIKVFKHAVRYLYENTNQNSKRTLCYLYRLIPFVNLRYNVLCTNPFEMNKDKINCLSLSDICEMFGLSSDHQKRFLNALKKLTFIDKEGHERSVITYAWDIKDKERYWVRINPQFFSGYIPEDELMDMITECSMKNELISF